MNSTWTPKDLWLQKSQLCRQQDHKITVASLIKFLFYMFAKICRCSLEFYTKLLSVTSKNFFYILDLLKFKKVCRLSGTSTYLFLHKPISASKLIKIFSSTGRK